MSGDATAAPDPRAWTSLRGSWGSLYRRDGAGARLLVLSGLGCPARPFAEGALERLPGDWDLWLWEAPGAGATPFEGPGQETLDELTAALADGLDTAAPEGRVWTVVGHSMGGLTGLLLCESRPDLVGAFVNVEGNLGPADCTFTADAVRLDFDEFLATWVPETAGRLARADEPGARWYGETLAALPSPRAYYLHSRSVVEHSSRDDLLERFCGLGRPVLYVHGARSGDPATVAALRARCDVTSIPGAGHFPHLDRPDVFYPLVESFVAGRAG